MFRLVYDGNTAFFFAVKVKQAVLHGRAVREVATAPHCQAQPAHPHWSSFHFTFVFR